jgi:TPR repeat protein
MRLGSALFIVLLVSTLPDSPLRAQSSPGGVLEVWLKARESADAPNSEKVSLYLKSKALVVGNDAYDGRGWPVLSNGVRDAEEVAKGLAAQGFEVTLKKNLKSGELDHVLKNFFIYEGAEQNTRLLVWFAGHGDTIDGEGYIVPIDAPSPNADADFRDKAISLRRFGEYMREARARHVLAIFDSCFSGSVFNVARALPPPAITLATTQSVRQFISSGEAEQQVSDDGTFRKLFLDVLAGREPQADANGDGYVTGTELGLFLHQKMTNLTNNRQTPRYGKLNALGYDRGDFVFQVGKLDAATSTISAPTLPPAPQPFSEPAEAWAVTQGTTSVAVLEEFVRQFGDTPYGRMAKARLEELRGNQNSAGPALGDQSSGAASRPQEAQRAWIGTRIQSVTDEIADRLHINKPARGALVVSVDGPAKVAGIERDDLIVRFDGKVINEMRDLPRVVADTPIGKDVEVIVLRGGNEQSKTVKVGRLEWAQTECDRLAGTTTAVDASKAIVACRQAIDLHPNDPALLFQLGRAYHADKNYSEALRFYRQAADLGGAAAMNNLGQLYQYGLGVTKDYSEAERFYRKAADLGNSFGMNNLALMYQNGWGVAKDQSEAVRLFRKSADLGNTNATGNLADMYQYGLGVTKDYGEAARLYRRAADLGNGDGMTSLGRMYEYGLGVAKDYDEAVRLFRKAADLGNTNAITNLGWMYRAGWGVARDYSESVRLYRKAADMGNSNAMTGLAGMYVQGSGVAKDYGEAARLYRKAIDLGNSTAMSGLAHMYVEGWGVTKDLGEAERLYRRSADLGNATGMTGLGWMYQNGFGVARNYSEALRLNRQATDLGNASATNNLGLMYMNGLGVSRDYGEAERLFRKAAELGEEHAKSNLDLINSRRRYR